MKKPLVKLGATVLLALATAFALPAKSILPISTETAFACYCNGHYQGEYTSIAGCYNSCQPQ